MSISNSSIPLIPSLKLHEPLRINSISTWQVWWAVIKHVTVDTSMVGDEIYDRRFGRIHVETKVNICLQLPCHLCMHKPHSSSIQVPQCTRHAHKKHTDDRVLVLLYAPLVSSSIIVIWMQTQEWTHLILVKN